MRIVDCQSGVWRASQGPTFSAWLGSGVLINNGTPALIPIGNIEFDTDSAFDSINYHFRPSTPGYYQINGKCAFLAQGSVINASVLLRKNGNWAWYKQGTSTAPSNNASNNPESTISTVVYLNGVDYVELFGASTDAPVIALAGQGLCFLSGHYVHN